MQIDLNIFSKQSLQLDPIITIDKLFEQSMTIDMDEFQVRHVTSLKYHMFEHMLCLDIFSEIQEYQILILNKLRLVECYKTLVDCIYDWGQFATEDNPLSEKPLSPFSKIIDKC